MGDEFQNLLIATAPMVVSPWTPSPNASGDLFHPSPAREASQSEAVTEGSGNAWKIRSQASEIPDIGKKFDGITGLTGTKTRKFSPLGCYAP
jgi:hypothetical protein